MSTLPGSNGSRRRRWRAIPSIVDRDALIGMGVVVLAMAALLACGLVVALLTAAAASMLR